MNTMLRSETLLETKEVPKHMIDERNEKIRKYGEFYLDYFDMERYFDPFRLKILMLPKDGANPFGKNPDYFFIKGIDYINLRDYSNAIKNFEKGVNDKNTHYLCRFNLGYALFKIGNF
jgi:tetratricopeptide (TPR) repeat protein